jgi:hypothetical protein
MGLGVIPNKIFLAVRNIAHCYVYIDTFLFSINFD